MPKPCQGSPQGVDIGTLQLGGPCLRGRFDLVDRAPTRTGSALARCTSHSGYFLPSPSPSPTSSTPRTAATEVDVTHPAPRIPSCERWALVCPAPGGPLAELTELCATCAATVFRSRRRRPGWTRTDPSTSSAPTPRTPVVEPGPSTGRGGAGGYPRRLRVRDARVRGNQIARPDHTEAREAHPRYSALRGHLRRCRPGDISAGRDDPDRSAAEPDTAADLRWQPVLAGPRP